jgi:rubrerythrin
VSLLSGDKKMVLEDLKKKAKKKKRVVCNFCGEQMSSTVTPHICDKCKEKVKRRLDIKG